VEDDETVEETTVTREVPSSATGLRLFLSLALIVFGLLLAAIGAFSLFGVSSLSVRVPLVLIGLAFVAGFALVAMGAQRVLPGPKGVPGADLPQPETVRTTVRKRGFPKRGTMPPKQGTMPSETTAVQPPERDPRSGGRS
jgi:hypothetical protein